VKELLDIQKNLRNSTKLEAYHDALERKEEPSTCSRWDDGLPEKAKIEKLYWEIGRAVVESSKIRLRAGGNSQAGGQLVRSVHVQFLRVPVPA